MAEYTQVLPKKVEHVNQVAIISTARNFPTVYEIIEPEIGLHDRKYSFLGNTKNLTKHQLKAKETKQKDSALVPPQTCASVSLELGSEWLPSGCRK